MPRVSVIIPVYNGERFIRQAIQSVLDQTVQDFEIIVVDDASTDGTATVIPEAFEHHMARTIRYLRNDRNRERAFSRNRGVDEASGDFIFFLDADDAWAPTYMENVLDVFAGGDNDIVYTFQRTFIDERGVVLRVSRKPLANDTGSLIFSSAVGYPTATAFKRQSFPRYRDRYIPREDWEVFLRAYIDGLRVSVLDTDLIRVRSHSGRTSRSLTFWKSTLTVYEDYRDRVPSPYLGRFLFHIGDVCLRFGDLSQGWALTTEAFVRDPLLALNARMVTSMLKRGLRIDKFIHYREQRKRLKEK